MYGDGFDRLYANGLFNVAKTVETELIDLGQGVRILPVVLNDVDVIRSGQQAGKGRCLGVPERSRDNALDGCQPERSRRGRCEGYGMRTVLDEDVETFLDQEGSVEDDEAVTER